MQLMHYSSITANMAMLHEFGEFTCHPANQTLPSFRWTILVLKMYNLVLSNAVI